MPLMREHIALGLKIFMYFVMPYLTALLTMAPSVGKALFDIDDQVFSSLIFAGMWSAILFGLVTVFSDVSSRVISGRISFAFILAGLVAGIVCLLLTGFAHSHQQRAAGPYQLRFPEICL